MPAPHPDRQNFLLYLRCEFPYLMDYLTLQENSVEYRNIFAGLQQLQVESPELYRILWLHTHTRLPRTYMVDLANFDTSTIKRHLNQAIDQVARNSGFVLAKDEQKIQVAPREIVFARNHFLHYLAKEYGRGENYTDLLGNVLERDRVSYGIEKLRDNDPKFSKMIFYHINAEFTKARIAQLTDADPSTVKRRLNYAADLVMQRARHSPVLDPLGGCLVLFSEAISA